MDRSNRPVVKILNNILPSKIILRMILGGMFILSALLKGTDVTRFSRLIENILNLSSSAFITGLSPYSYVIAFSILVLELVISAMLLSGLRIKLAAVLSLIALSVFTLITINIGKSISDGDCGCFGILLPRSTIISVTENIVFMLIAASLLTNSQVNIKPNLKFASMLIVGGVLWMGVFFSFPPPWAALRAGSTWTEITAEPPLPQEDSFFIWLMSPECLDCQNKTDFINDLVEHNLNIIALTDVTKGRVAEYNYDWEPRFNLHRITAKRMKVIGLSLGTLISIRNDKIVDIWKLDELELNKVIAKLKNKGKLN